MCLGIRAHSMLSNQHFEFPKVEADVILKFYPKLGAMIIDDKTRDPSQEPDSQTYEQFAALVYSSDVAREVSFFKTKLEMHFCSSLLEKNFSFILDFFILHSDTYQKKRQTLHFKIIGNCSRNEGKTC